MSKLEINQILIWVLVLAFLIRTIRNVLYQVFLWQLKEYRPDRLLIHLRTWQGKKLLFSPISLIKWFLIFFYFLGLPIFLLVVILYGFEAILNLKEVVSGLKKPVFTLKATFVVLVVIIGSALLALLFPKDLSNLSNLAVRVLILDKLLSPAVAILFLGLAIPTKLHRARIIAQAKKIIKNHPKLLVIGITGSYGKTSTKEFLASILSTKFKVLRTVGSNNTDIGVAETIVRNLSDQEVFVCEMAAYKRGEIKAICDIVRPKIGIITAINEQHLDLFGSLENTKRAKYELIESLPKDGLAVFNGNNSYTLELAKKTKKLGLTVLIYQYINISIYESGLLKKSDGRVTASDIKVFPQKLEFEVQIGREKGKLTTNLLGKQNIENILAGIGVAHYLGMNLKEITAAVRDLRSPEMTMKPFPGPSGSILIDDTFSVNPAGVLAALEYAEIYKGKKILVLQPMIELGEAAEKAHREVGRVSAKICDLVILTNRNFNKPFFEGAGRDRKKVLILDGRKAAKKIEEIADKGGVVVFECKEAARVLTCLTQNA